MFQVRRISCPSKFASVMAPHFRDFYARSPWGDYFMCGSCANDFDPASWKKYESQGVCPCCSSVLEPVWTEARLRNYLRLVEKTPGFMAVGLFHSEDLVGWVWGFSKEPSDFYVDFIGLVPSLRRVRGLLNMFNQLLYLIRMRLSPTRSVPFLDWYLVCVAHMYSAQLFMELVRLVGEAGYTSLSSRTHYESVRIRRVFRASGFQEIGPD